MSLISGGPLQVRVLYKHEDGIEGGSSYVVEDMKSCLKGQNAFRIEKDKRWKSTA